MDSPSIKHLKLLKELLLIEREEDFLQYKEQFLKAGIERRKKNGVTDPVIHNPNAPESIANKPAAILELPLHKASPGAQP